MDKGSFEMHKSSSFSVKDLLDLPGANKLHQYGVNNGLTALESTDMSALNGDSSSTYYEASENTYARWLQSNEAMQQYSGKMIQRQLTVQVLRCINVDTRRYTVLTSSVCDMLDVWNLTLKYVQSVLNDFFCRKSENEYLRFIYF